jgi:hypothetical protein
MKPSFVWFALVVPCLLLTLLQVHINRPIIVMHSNASMTKNETHTEPYPRWSGGIKIEDLVQALRVSLDRKLYVNRVHTVYIVTNDGQLLKASVDQSKKSIRPGRESRMESLALAVLHRPDLIDAYPYLKSALAQGGFPYMANHGDSKFCLEPTPFTTQKEGGRIVLNTSVPIFTNSAPVLCTKSFPYPNYRTITQASSNNWTQLVQDYEKAYPWHKKKRQAVWRGAPTGTKNPDTNARLQLVRHAEQRPDLIDAKFVRSNESPDFDGNHYFMPMEEFQHYRAIVDADGNSWSARFAQQLCFSSVTIKIEPRYVDYFHAELEPWVHYIPVSASMSDLYKHIEFAISDAHEERVREIVANANRWCSNKLRPEQLLRDLSHIWNAYLQQLYEADADWSELWRLEKARLMDEYNFTVVDCKSITTCSALGIETRKAG